MTKSLGIAAATAAALLYSGAALAHDCHQGPFNGLYVGASVGYVGLDSDFAPEGQSKLSASNGSAIAGGNVGYNLQCGRFVVGVEGDISYVDLSSKVTATDQTTFRSDMDWLATLRGRLGVVVHDHVLVYATAGVAWADRTHAVNDPGTVSGIAFSQSDTFTSTGWVVGGGADILLDHRWFLRAEALYVGLKDDSRTYTVTTGCGSVCTSHTKWEDDVFVARIGLGLKFGAHEQHYEPLK